MPRLLAIVVLLALAACNTTPTLNDSVVISKKMMPQGATALNRYRAAAGRPALVRSARLDAAARTHAADMAARNFFSHTGSNGSSHTNRIRAQGCSGGAENIAEGPYTRASVMAAWMGSSGHRRNILLPAATHYGIANVGDKWVMKLSRNCP